jgi:SnoaL-like domain
MPRGRVAALAAIAVIVAGAAWYYLTPTDSTAVIRQRLNTLADDINKSTRDGRGPEARALELASYLTDDVELDFGPGSPPIQGRATVIGMAGRLQPRTAAFTLRFQDMNVALAPDGQTAEVHLTAEFIRRSMTTGEESLDAREFTMALRLVGSDWKISKVVAIQTLK